MDRRSLLALFKFRTRPAVAMAVPLGGGKLPPDVVYAAAQVIRERIDTALAASRLDTPISGSQR